MKKLKILILSDYGFAKGGAEQVAIASSLGLSKKHEVVFFCAVGPVSRQLEESRVSRIICLGQEDILDSKNKIKAMAAGIYNVRAVRELNKLVSRWEPDIVHMHGLSKALSWAPVSVFYSNNIPVVYTIHDYGLFCPNLGIYNYRQQASCDYYRKGFFFKCLATNCDKRNYAQKLWRWARYNITKRLIRFDKKVSAFIVVSSFLKNFVDKNLDTKRPVALIYNPLHVGGRGNRKKSGREDGPVRFLYVGRLSKEKGLELLLEAIRDVDAELTIIGEGELMERCLALSADTGGRVKVPGYMDRESVFGHMQRSDCLVLASKCLEPAPLVLAEACYNGLPSLVADHGGLSEFIKDGVNGFYFKPDDLSSLKEAMDKIVKDPGILEPLRQNCRVEVEGMGLGIDSHVNELYKLYLKLIGERRLL